MARQFPHAFELLRGAFAVENGNSDPPGFTAGAMPESRTNAVCRIQLTHLAEGCATTKLVCGIIYIGLSVEVICFLGYEKTDFFEHP